MNSQGLPTAMSHDILNELMHTLYCVYFISLLYCTCTIVSHVARLDCLIILGQGKQALVHLMDRIKPSFNLP